MDDNDTIEVNPLETRIKKLAQLDEMLGNYEAELIQEIERNSSYRFKLNLNNDLKKLSLEIIQEYRKLIKNHPEKISEWMIQSTLRDNPHSSLPDFMSTNLSGDYEDIKAIQYNPYLTNKVYELLIKHFSIRKANKKGIHLNKKQWIAVVTFCYTNMSLPEAEIDQNIYIDAYKKSLQEVKMDELQIMKATDIMKDYYEYFILKTYKATGKYTLDILANITFRFSVVYIFLSMSVTPPEN